MYPYLPLFGFNIPVYGICALLGLIIALVFVLIRNRRFALPKDDILYIVILGIIGVIIDSKLLYIITLIPPLISGAIVISNWGEFLLSLMSQGSVFYGGLFGALLAAYIYLKHYRLDIGRFGDLLAPGIPLFHVFARIGCFMSGCCYGIPYEHGLTFPHSIGSPTDIALLPIQLIESGVNLVIFAVLLLSEKRRKPGTSLKLYLLLYAIARFVLEFFRGDLIRGFIGPLSTSQWISLAILVVLLVQQLRQRRVSRAA